MGTDTPPRPVSSFHAELDNKVQINLQDYRFYVEGTGLRQNANQVGNIDASVDYGLALRTASIKLRGDLPTMVEIRRLQNAIAMGKTDGTENDPAFVYKDLVHTYIFGSSSATGAAFTAPFARQMMQFWRNTLRMGGEIKGLFQHCPTAPANEADVNLETGPAFMARLTVTGDNMTKAFTSPSGNCPSFNPSAAPGSMFGNGECNQMIGSFTINTRNTPTLSDDTCTLTRATGTVNGVSKSVAMFGNNVPTGQEAGILTNPGFMAQYYSNMGFRRARLIQELFGCTRMPSEFASTPEPRGAYVYSSPWPFDSVPNGSKPPEGLNTASRQFRTGTQVVGDVTEYVDFRGDCQNCHSTMNHRAALFAVFDAAGYMHPTGLNANLALREYRVVTPVAFSPFTQLKEYLPPAPDPSSLPAWKFGKTAQTFQEFGAHMAQDPEVSRCFMSRIWNHAYSRDDIVEQLALVPPSVTETLHEYFVKNNYNLKLAIEKLYTDANFIRF